MINNNNYYTVQGWMVNDLGLTGDELTVYAILWGFSQDGVSVSRTPKQYFIKWTGRDERTINNAIKNLEQKELIKIEHTAGMPSSYKIVPPTKLYPLQNCGDTPYKNEGGTPYKNVPTINNINNDIKAQYARENELFDKWWGLYGGNVGKGGCLSYWRTLSEEEMLQVIAHTPRYMSKAVAPLTPYEYLVRRQYWRNEKPSRKDEYAQVVEDNRLQSVSGMVMAGDYQIIPKEEALKKGLKILIDYDNELPAAGQ